MNPGTCLTESHRRGFDVSVAEEGEQGLQKVHEAPFDLVVPDLLMPRMDGFRFMQKLSEAVPNPLPILVPLSFGN